MLGSKSDLPSEFDESELPPLPGEGSESITEVPPLPGAEEEKQTQVAPPGASGGRNSGSTDSVLIGTWRVYSERLFYDDGGGGTTFSASSGTAVTQTLKLNNDGTYTYGDSKGNWKMSSVSDSDWISWGITSYGSTRKITLEGWNKGTASGPLEEESGVVNFVWVLYKVGPPTVSKPGTVHLKFGR